MIHLKSAAEIDTIGRAGAILAELYREIPAQVRPGVIVEYVPEEGAKGPKAAQVRALGDDLDVRRPAGRPVERPDGEVDVLSPREFEDAITEMLLRAEPTLTGSQILHLRGRLGTMARGYGWVED